VSSAVKRSLRCWPFCSFVCTLVGLFLSCVSACDLFSFDIVCSLAHLSHSADSALMVAILRAICGSVWTVFLGVCNDDECRPTKHLPLCVCDLA